MPLEPMNGDTPFLLNYPAIHAVARLFRQQNREHKSRTVLTEMYLMGFELLHP